MSRMSPEESARQERMHRAEELLALRSKFALQHIAMGGGCACGVGGVVLSMSDIERDIADYLKDEAQRLGQHDIVAFIDAHGGGTRLDTLLYGLSDEFEQVSAQTADWLLQRLARSLRSFSQQHGGGQWR